MMMEYVKVDQKGQDVGLKDSQEVFFVQGIQHQSVQRICGRSRILYSLVGVVDENHDARTSL